MRTTTLHFSLLALVSAWAPLQSFSAEPTELPAPTVLDKIVVSGEQPGPGLWKVTKGTNVLWVLGEQSPMPQKMTWRAKGIEKIVSESQEIIGEPGVGITAKNVGLFSMISMIPSVLSVKTNPDGRKLKDMVPADVYARWISLRDKYIDDTNTNNEEPEVENWRPIFAAFKLYDEALKKNKYTQASLVWPVIRAAAKKHNVKIRSAQYEVDMKDPRRVLNEFRASNLADQDCFAKTLERIETDLENMRVRSNAWAVGDIQAVLAAPATDQRAACDSAFRSAQFMNAGEFKDLNKEAEKKWMDTALGALEKNAVTLAVVPMRFFHASGGYLEKIKARGYAVTAPAGALE